MISLILVFNILLAAMCFYIAWQMLLWRKTLSQVADALIDAERVTHEVLNGAPEGIIQGQVSAYALRHSYRQLESQLSKAQKIRGFLSLGRGMWRSRYSIPLLRKN
jgi:hypothetical protein